MKRVIFVPVVLALLAPGAALATGESTDVNIFVDQSGATTNLIPGAEDKVWTDYFLVNPATVVAPNGFNPPPDFFVPRDANGEAIKVKLVLFPCPSTQGSCPFDRTGMTPAETEQFFEDRLEEPIFRDGFESRSVSAFNTVP